MYNVRSNAEPVLSNAERQARFKANKEFKSLPADVQYSIDSLSDSPEERASRIAIASDYQKRMGKRVSTGLACWLQTHAAREAVALGVKERYVSAG